jgi:hypothetical protein
VRGVQLGNALEKRHLGAADIRDRLAGHRIG